MPVFRSFAVVCALISLAFLQCSRTPKSRHTFRIEERDGVRTATTAGGTRYAGELFEYREELRLIGDPEHPDSYLVNPDPPVVDADGNFYVNDSRGNQIVVFDAEGRFVRAIGRKGEGPGDLDFPRNLCIVGDTLQVNSHVVAWRLTRFATDGHLIDVSVHRVPTNMAMPTLYRAPTGQLMIRIDDYPVLEDDWFIQSRMVVLSSAADTIAGIATARVPFGKTIARDEEGTPYAPEMMAYVGYPTLGFRPEQGIFTSTGMEPVLRFYDLTGSLTRIIRIDLAPEAVSSEERSAFLSAVRSDLQEERNKPGPSAYTITRLEGMIADPPLPQYKGYWRHVDIDDAGWIWLSMVEPPTEVQPEQQAPRYRVLSPEGEYLGDTVWPMLVSGHIRGGRLLGIREDPETGERIPVVFRLIARQGDYPGEVEKD